MSEHAVVDLDRSIQTAIKYSPELRGAALVSREALRTRPVSRDAEDHPRGEERLVWRARLCRLRAARSHAR